jgi:hypothetical protein
MADMERSVVSASDFILLKKLLVSKGILEENWLETIKQFTTGRSLIAKQAIEIIQLIENDAPFEKFELACYLYEQMINKDSYQMVINCFDDEADRLNLIHRLGINKREKLATSSANNNFAI